MRRRLGKAQIATGIIILLTIIYPQFVGQSSYFMSLFVMACIYSISAMSLNLMVGFGGQISVGNAGFLMIGAYTVAILAKHASLPIWLLLPASGLTTAIISLLIGLPAVRLSGHFLAVATLGFGLAISPIALNWESVTNGFSGLSVQRPSLVSSDIQFFYIILIVTLLITWMLTNILKSGMGRAFVAIRESEITAEATGIHTSFYKIIMFVISAFFTGIAGGLSAYWIGFVSPDNFSITTSLLLLAMIVVGGLASIPGSIIGAVLFTVIPHFTESFDGITNMVIGAMLIVIIIFRPAGLVSLADRFTKRIKSSRAEESKGGTVQDAHF